MKILLLGKNGQVGWELQRALAPVAELIALDRHGLGGWCGDLAQPEALLRTIREIQPDVVVNASAYTAVDLAESNQEMAQLINSDTVAQIAEVCKSLNILLVHYSTDYVFSGQGTTPFKETDQTQPLNVYGQTKLQGEQAIVASGCQHLIFRTSWVYAAKGKNFLKTMLSLAQQREQLSIIDDQIGAPTSAVLIADITAHAIVQTMADFNKVGIYHLVAAGETSWFAYANYVFEQAKQQGMSLKVQTVNAISTADYPTPAKRPHNSRLDIQKIQHTFQLHVPEWTTHVQRTISELLIQ